MKYIEMEETKRVFVIRLETGEDIIEKLESFIKLHNIKCGSIMGIGALSKATIGFFDTKQKKYIQSLYEENFELISLLGNISWKDNKPIVHCHFALGRSDKSIIGGHVLSPCSVSVTCEIYIFEGKVKMSRIHDESWNLFLLDLK